ncbi:T9SS type B sorting domain-containing protein [Polaribacter sargassicola]|uniref:T9SS type B sorting domain-containing protein n=1 Tax=Polaribacter sargassicola TaxID=2836891 RepID=UPI001F2EB98C|nr:T9SS type B sorting domain-containing protein [Polaribacter sp. DS7-9]MCG1036574.1 T9SS type B sorting domain-containing protein [Polaribacter sp. DS7-9]
MTHLTSKISYLKLFIFAFFFVISSSIFSQTVSVDDTSYTTDNLVEVLLGNTCVPFSNSNFSSNQSVGYFNNNGGDFPISEGVIIRNGFVRYSGGEYTGDNISTTISTNGDASLQEISDNETDEDFDLTDTAFLEFEFTPIGNNFNFNYIFASNEYGKEQCERGDLFAIFLTNVSTGETTNIATVADNKSISVRNIRSGEYNVNCFSENADLFSTYNLDQLNDDDDTEVPAANTIINMKGYTTLLNASATVIPNQTYKLRFVIADYNDSDFDSAVFIETGSFDGSLDLGEDTEICGGEEIVLDSGFSGISGFSFEWKKNGVLLSENGPTLSVSELGEYSLSVSNSTCTLTDEIIISGFVATKPNDVQICTESSTINITSQVDINTILNGANSSDFTISYYTSETDANNYVNQITDPTSYQIPSNNFTLWTRLSNDNYTDCFDVVSFGVNIDPLPAVDNLSDVYECTEYTLPSISNGNYYSGSGGTGSSLNPGDRITSTRTIYIYNNNGICSNETSFTVNFSSDFEIEKEQCGSFEIPNTPLGKFYTAENGGGTEITAGTIIENDTTIYFYSVGCSISKEFNITINEIPPLDTFDTIITCNSYTFPKITNGGYFSFPNGEGRHFSEGEVFTQSRGFYGYSIDPATGCTNNSFFQLIIIKPDTIEREIQSCGTYIVPDSNYGNLYSDNSYQTIIPPNTEITNSQTVYYYVPNITGDNCTGFEVNIIINDIPVVDSFEDITRCESELPTLPVLTNGEYYTKTGGPDSEDQELIAEGSEISETQTIYIYNSNGNCDVESSFKVTIIPLPIIPSVFDQDINECETYTLPELEFGGSYYTESGGPNGTGTQLSVGDAILESQTIYIYNESEDLDGCYNEKSFFIEILKTQVDVLEDVKTCDSSYILEPLNVGEYYTEPEGAGTKLFAGDIINTTQTIYIYKDDPNFIPCQNQSSFTVTMYTTPTLDPISDLESCGSVTLPTITIPNTIVEFYLDDALTEIITPTEYTITDAGTRNIYVKAYPEGNPDCYIQDMFTITVHPLLDFNIQDGAICINPDTNEVTNPYLLDTQLDPSYYDIKWYFEGELLNNTSISSWQAIEPGTYTIEATVINPISNSDCDYNTIDVIVEGSSPVFEINFLSNNFSDTYDIEINAVNEGAGDYVYAIDSGEFQTSNQFDNIIPGTYNVIVRDLTGTCSDITLELIALDYQRFFTPNGDGVNDTWNINDLKNDLTATITIYDRYGNLIKTIKPSGSGWDGLNNNGNKMQNTDYWFLLKYTKEGQQATFRSHFSLLRK